MSQATRNKLVKLAKEASSTSRKVSPMQLAGMLLEDALVEYEGGQ
jgi:hypothetical protein